MKKNALIILAVFFNLNLQAQYFNMLSKYENLDDFLIVDSASFRYTYKLIYLKDTLKFNEKSEDIQVLLLGKNTPSYWISSFNVRASRTFEVICNHLVTDNKDL